MKFNRFLCLTILLITLAPQVTWAIEYRGTKGPGKGKHIVLVSGDHEYRSEESLPALGRILAKHHGFRCTVLFNVDKKTGYITPGNNNLPGLEALKTADLMVIMTRFQNLPDEQMKHIDDYLNRGGPVVGLRTATHGFKIPKNGKYAKYTFNNKNADYKGGFGRQVLGETWVGHYGRNHVKSTRYDIIDKTKEHPVLRGVIKPWAQAGTYFAKPIEGSTVLCMAQPLLGMKSNSPVDKSKKAVPGAWVRTYTSTSGKKGRVFTSTNGASEDILDKGYRRMLINACFWTLAMEKEIKKDLNISFVGPYHPTTYNFGGYRKEVKPKDLSGWDTPILSPDKQTGKRKKKKKVK